MFLELSQISQENNCARVSFLTKLQASGIHFIKKRLWHGCFPVNFTKNLRTLFIIEHLWWLPGERRMQRNVPPAYSFIKMRLWHSCFPVNFAKFLRIPFWQNIFYPGFLYWIYFLSFHFNRKRKEKKIP